MRAEKSIHHVALQSQAEVAQLFENMEEDTAAVVNDLIDTKVHGQSHDGDNQVNVSVAKLHNNIFIAN